MTELVVHRHPARTGKHMVAAAAVVEAVGAPVPP